MEKQSERGGETVHSEMVFAVLLIVSILLISFTRASVTGVSLSPISILVSGIQRTLGKTSDLARNATDSIARLRNTRERYAAALETLNKYRGLEWDLLKLRRENAALRENLQLSKQLSYKQIPARVIAGSPSNLFATLVLDKGIEEGIRPGMAVGAYEDGVSGILGKIVRVTAHSAEVRPLTDPDNYIAARLQNSRYTGLVGGEGNESGDLVMKYVRKAAGTQISINDMVVSSGHGSVYPEGIAIGRVKEVRSYDYSSSLELILIPIVDVTRVEFVFVLKEHS